EVAIGLAAIDEILLAVGHGLGGVLSRAQIKRLAVLEMAGNAADAELEALAQHRHRDSAPHHRAGLAFLRRSAIIVVADLDRGEARPERPLEIEEAPPGQLVARRPDSGRVD